MELRKTTILPSDEKALAQRMFHSLVHEQANVLLVVLGKGAEAETFVQRADRLAGLPGEPRWVCWARKPDQIAELIAELEHAGDLADSLDDTRGFALSLGDEVRDRIRAQEPVPSLTRVLFAYVRAERAPEVDA